MDRVAAAGGQLVLDERATAVGEDGGPAEQARALLPAASGRGASDTAALRGRASRLPHSSKKPEEPSFLAHHGLIVQWAKGAEVEVISLKIIHINFFS
jgi:hypothetical protein